MPSIEVWICRSGFKAAFVARNYSRLKRKLSFETASNIFIQNWALLAHIHLHLLDASFTKLKQGPSYRKTEVHMIHIKRDTGIQHRLSKIRLVCFDLTPYRRKIT